MENVRSFCSIIQAEVSMKVVYAFRNEKAEAADAETCLSESERVLATTVPTILVKVLGNRLGLTAAILSIAPFSFDFFGIDQPSRISMNHLDH
jgi:hypothetical protein